MMDTRTTIATVLTLGGLLGWVGAWVYPSPLVRAKDARTAKPASGSSIVLPEPEPKFEGRIGRTFKESTPGVFPATKPPAGAPNVLFVLIDDCGFGQWGTFGGQVPAPNLPHCPGSLQRSRGRSTRGRQFGGRQ
jgi:hypothetical protein